MTEDAYIWTTRDGEQMDVRDMTDRHLSNAIHFMERRRVEAQRELAGLSVEDARSPFKYTGGGALEQAYTDLNTWLGACDHTLLIMRREWARRHQASKE